MKVEGKLLAERGKGSGSVKKMSRWLTIPAVVRRLMAQLEPLPAKMLVNPEMRVFKHVLMEIPGRGSVGVLFLEPKAHIKSHKHTDDCEFYIAVLSRKKLYQAEFCDIGESHELENLSSKRWAWVIYVKFSA